MTDRFLHLRLCWDLINNLEGVNVGVKRSAKGVRVISLVESGKVLCDLSPVGPVMVGRSGVNVSVPEFEDCVCPTEVRFSH